MHLASRASPSCAPPCRSLARDVLVGQLVRPAAAARARNAAPGRRQRRDRLVAARDVHRVRGVLSAAGATGGFARDKVRVVGGVAVVVAHA
eukprot:5417517-Prymnesium_polylepis.1